MRRLLDHYLTIWQQDPARTSLLIRGARQVGKTFTVRKFAEAFTNLVEVNFERNPDLATLFDRDLDPGRISRDLALALGVRIEPGKTLLFLDEIQQAPRALTALRYFHEDLPSLHVIAAGSLVEFAVEEIGLPVGRVNSLYMYPMSFLEFLNAKGQSPAVSELAAHSADVAIAGAVHDRLMREVGEYLAVGGMPEAVQEWVDHGDLSRCAQVQRRLAETYRQDFAKYSRKNQIKYVDLLFNEVPRLLGRKFVFSHVAGNRRRRDLQPALELLAKAGVVHPVFHTAATGLPLGAEADPDRFKVIFMDVGLAESILGLDGATWILDPTATFANAGQLAEAFVGQELIAYGQPHAAPRLYYWHREARSSNAEVDYLHPAAAKIVPVEVKRGTGGWLRSLRLFLESRPAVSPYGVRFSPHNFSVMPDLQSYPLYAVGSFAAENDPQVREAIQSLV